MNKTPIMILQEITMKLGTLPVYSEVSQMSLTHQHEYITKVEWKNYKTQGKGASKKTAKQNAALEMLLLLISSKEISESTLSLLPENITPKKSTTSLIMHDSSSFTSNSPETSTVLVSSSEKTFVNYVGLLNEYCLSKEIPTPIYSDYNIVGPPHLSVFTVNCTAASVCQEGSAYTKKAAKQEAAKKVLESLEKAKYSVDCKMSKTEDTMNTLKIQFMELAIDQPKSDTSNLEKILSTYDQLKRQFDDVSHNLIPINNYLTVLSNLCETIPQIQKDYLASIYKMRCSTHLNNLKSAICTAIKTTMQEINLQTTNNHFMIGFKLITKPIILQIAIGVTREEAKRNALYKLYEYIFLLLK